MNRASSVAAVGMLLMAGCVVGSEVVIEPQDPELVEAGAELYSAHCAECHGSDLRGTDKGPSHLSIIYEPNHHADGAFLFAVQNGVRAHHWAFGDMPPIEGLSPEDIKAITAFVREGQRVEGFESDPPVGAAIVDVVHFLDRGRPSCSFRRRGQNPHPATS